LFANKWLKKKTIITSPDSTMQKLIKVAAGELGVIELAGPDHHPRILQYAREAGFTQVTTDETAWCSIFLSWCCLKAGLKRSTQLNARSWLTMGQPVSQPEPGDIAVFWRVKIDSWEGHVGIFTGTSIDGKRIYTLGGNQGNRVSITGNDASTVLGYRRLTTLQMLVLPEPLLKKGDNGQAVAQLQDILKELGQSVGTSDGDFGNKTEAGVKALQAQSGSIPITGVYDPATRHYLQNLLQL